MTYYNLERNHQGYRLGGRTPALAVCEASGILDFANIPDSSTMEDATVTDSA